jgi:hypothetical protein
MEGGCDGKILRCGAGERHQQGRFALWFMSIGSCRFALFPLAIWGLVAMGLL